MDSVRFQTVRRLFEEAEGLSEDRQRAFLKEQCEDASIRAEVLAMLEANRTRSSILDLPVDHAARQLFGHSDNWLSRSFGHYRTIRFLGEGGMGVVYLAERDDLGSQSAIKILRDSMSPARRARFLEEQKTLARLSHPGIARIYDADVLPEGTPWFAMEYVDGVSLTEFCWQLSFEDRVRLFRDVCEAVRYAHSQLIVHRDLKPSNILVTKDGSVKLLDFGVSKHLEQAVGIETSRTVFRAHTPSYASPEQIRGEATGTYTDVYALGVILYELLTGRRPFDLERCSPAEADRIVHEVEPERPSSLVRRPGKRWAELDTLCLTALHRDPQRRYGSADALIRDIDHYLHDEPLDAHADSVWYRSSKFWRRHRRAMVSAAAVVVIVLTMVMFFTARLVAARDQARNSAKRTERIQQFMLNLFDGGDNYAGPREDLRVVSMLERGVQEARNLSHEPAVQAELNHTLAGLYQKLGDLKRSETLFRTALEERINLFGAGHPEVLRTQAALGLVRLDQSELEESEKILRKALETAVGNHAGDDVLVGNCMAALGKVLAVRGAYGEAIPMLEQATALQSRGGDTPEFSNALTDLANALYNVGRYDEAEAMNRELLLRDRQLYGHRHPTAGIDLFNLGNLALDRGEYQEAEQYFRESLDILQIWYGKEHPKAARSLLMLGVALESNGKLSEAESLYRQALALQTRAYGPNHVLTGQVLNYLGTNALKQHKLNDAETLFRRTADLFKAALGENHEFHLMLRAKLGDVYVARKEYTAAEHILRPAVVGLRAVLPAGHRYTGIAEIILGRALAGEKKFRDAEAFLLSGYQALQKHARSAVPEIQSAKESLVQVYSALHEPDKAAEFRN